MRSNNGCWTCRLRHRKCDEAAPACRLCVKSGVQCHGYDRKPVWMDGGRHERSQALRIKAQAQEARRSVLKSPKERQNWSTVTHELQSRQSCTSQSSSATVLDRCSLEEAKLLIHFLDVILPLQFPFLSDDRRPMVKSWFYWLLTKNGALRDTALSLSALHRSRTMVSHGEIDLYTYYARALEKLQISLHRGLNNSSNCDYDGLTELLAVGTCLVSFEIFQGGVGDWQLHLTPLIRIVELLEPLLLDKPTNASDTRSCITDAVQVLVSVVICFDIHSTTSLGTSPQTKYRNWLGALSFDMAEVTGCQSWLAVLMGDIATLNVENVAKESYSELLSCNQMGDQLPERLSHGLSKLQASEETHLLRLPPEDGALVQTVPCQIFVSQLFALAATVQWHTIVAGPDPTNPIIRQTISTFLHVMKIFPKSASIRGLVWPLCVAGSMAEACNQREFEKILLRTIPHRHCDFGNCAAVLKVLRTCWAMRLLHPEKLWDWRSAMNEIQYNVLLV